LAGGGPAGPNKNGAPATSGDASPLAVADRCDAATRLDYLLAPALKYFQVGMNQAAHEAIGRIPPALRATREVLTLQAFICQEAGGWLLLCDVAKVLVRDWPNDSQHWIWLADGTRHHHTLAAAEQVLLAALLLHESEPMIHFGLACYAAQADKLDEARGHLIHAARLDPHCRMLALDAPDLAPLWAALGNTPPASGT
jgi:hypothetical protein